MEIGVYVTLVIVLILIAFAILVMSFGFCGCNVLRFAWKLAWCRIWDCGNCCGCQALWSVKVDSKEGQNGELLDSKDSLELNGKLSRIGLIS